jgi:Pyridoxamine 5'-phosphate oxidase
MTADEAWAFVESAHTGIFTTLRRDGVPMALPIWFATLDRRIYLSTRGKKVKRVANDSRCSFLVEAGERWAELQAVHLTGVANIIELDEKLGARFAEQIRSKYAPFRTTSNAMPDATREVYAAAGTVIEIVPDERIVSWDNNFLGLA